MSIAEALQSQHQGYAEALATEIARRLPSHVERDELIGFAMVGLAEAAGQFDPSRGVSFETFAYYRVRGAVFDGIRKIAWLPPRTRGFVAAEAGADLVAETAAREGTEVDVSELCSAFSRATRRMGAVFLASQLGSIEDGRCDDVGASDAAERRELRRALSAAVEALPDDDRRLVQALYVEQRSMTECARELGVNKSTVSRQHAKVIDRLREVLSA